MIFLLNILNFLQGLGVYLFLFLSWPINFVVDVVVKNLPGPVIDSVTPEDVKRSDGPVVVVVKGKRFNKELQVILNFVYGNIHYFVKNIKFINSEQFEFNVPVDIPVDAFNELSLQGLMVKQNALFGLIKKYATHNFQYVIDM